MAIFTNKNDMETNNLKELYWAGYLEGMKAEQPKYVHTITVNRTGNDEPIIIWSNDTVYELGDEKLNHIKEASSFNIAIHLRDGNDVNELIALLVKLESFLNND